MKVQADVADATANGALLELKPEVLRWLVENEERWRNFSLPALVKKEKEIERVLDQHKVRA